MRPCLLPLIAGVLLLVAACGAGAAETESKPRVTPFPTPLATPAPEGTPTPFPKVAGVTARPFPKVTAAPTTTPTPRPVIGSPWVFTPFPTLPPALPPVPPSDGSAAVVSRGNPDRMVVAFTFDAGADVGYTEMILDTLKVNGIRASFGITGLWAERNPDLVRRIAADGHTFINHSYDHSSFTGSAGTPTLSREQRWHQLDRTEAIISGLTGSTTLPYFRPPHGAWDESVNRDIAARGYFFNVMWTVDSRGWLGWSAGAIARRCLDQASPGAIYVFHVGSESRDGPALQSIIGGLRAQGYAIGGIADVLAP